MKTNRSVEIQLGGKERSLKYTIEAIELLEKTLNKNALSLALEPPSDIKITELIDLVQIGLMHEDKKLKREKVAQWVSDFLAENPVYALNVIAVSALGYSGLVGQVSVFENMLSRFQNKSTKDGEDEGK